MVNFEFDDQTAMPAGEPEPWGKDAVAYHLLAYDIIRGAVQKGMKPKPVQKTRPQYLRYDLKKFGNNLRNMLKYHAMGKLASDHSKIQDFIGKGGGGGGGGRGGDGLDGMTAGFDTLGFSDDEGDSPAKKKSGGRRPGNIEIPFKPEIIKMTLPLVQFSWDDKDGRKRHTIIIHLPAGVFLPGCVGARVVGGRRVVLTLDLSHLSVLDPTKYGKAFKDKEGQLLYSASNVKTVSHKHRVRVFKGVSNTSPVKAEFGFNTDIEVENGFTDAEGHDGFQVLRMGPEANPQIFAHLELMGKRDGFYEAQPAKFEDFTEDESDEEEEDMETED